MPDHKVYRMSFGKIYPLLVAKAEKKGRSRQEVDEVITWLTGYTAEQLQAQIAGGVDYQAFFAQAPRLNPARAQITGTICGVRIQDIEEPTMREIRYLDKLIDELARGRPMEKILRR